MLKSRTSKKATKLSVENSPMEIIPWKDFQAAIAPMWGIEDAASIPIINNPYRVISYPVEEWPTKVLHYPLRFVEDGQTKGYTCVYNVSDTVVRIRGIYILPEFRGSGAGMRMTQAALGMFPIGFNRLIGFFKETTAQKFIDHCGFKPFPNADWLWSEYQQIRLRAMYWDRGVIPSKPIANRKFIDSELDRFGFGGTNNLNTEWTVEEWIEYATPHVTAYREVGLSLRF